MKRLSLSIAAALALPLAAGAVTTAHAAAGDGIAKACVSSFEAAAAKRKNPGRFHQYREALCGCLEERIKADAKIDDANKDKVRVVFETMAKDRAEGRKMQRAMPRDVNRQIGGHARACTRKVVPAPKGETAPKGDSGNKPN